MLCIDGRRPRPFVCGGNWSDTLVRLKRTRLETALFEARNHVPAVAYVVGRYDGLDTSGSAFYLTAWESDDPEVVRERLGRLSRMAEELIDVLEEPPAR